MPTLQATRPRSRLRSGLRFVIRGAFTNFPLNGQIKRQECLNHSTPEAEIVASGLAAPREGLPDLDLRDVLSPSSGPLTFHEDSEAMIRICRSDRNPTMRHVLRSHAVSVAYLHEVFSRPDLSLEYVQTERQAADIYTNAFVNDDSWVHVARLIGVHDMASCQRCPGNPCLVASSAIHIRYSRGG